MWGFARCADFALIDALAAGAVARAVPGLDLQPLIAGRPERG